jgi:uncharacterized protein YjbI with pentapeptide repeats
VLLGAAVAAGLTFFLTWLVLKIPPTGTLPAPGADGTSPFLDVLKVALTVSAGVGGAVALVVAYRRQRHLEVDDAGRRSRYTSAAQQLGDPQAAVRLAGVYAMAHLADEWAEQRQQCVDVLCAYLRLPGAGDHPTQLEPNTTTTEHTWPDGGGQRKVTKTYSGRAGEREVRQTIVRVIALHLRPHTARIAGSRISWSNLEIDLTNAALPNADFTDANFRGRISFRRATFSGYASFQGAKFSVAAPFHRATFSGDASFRWATFSGDASFAKTTFYGGADFQDAKFSLHAIFDEAKFSGGADFTEAKFSYPADFGEATFSRNAFYSRATFSARAYFYKATFSRMASFDEAKFLGAASFDVATFSSDAYFDGATFSGDASFSESMFSGDANFERAQFSGKAGFARASIASRSVFDSALAPPSKDALNKAVFRDEQPVSPQVPPSTA